MAYRFVFHRILYLVHFNWDLFSRYQSRILPAFVCSLQLDKGPTYILGSLGHPSISLLCKVISKLYSKLLKGMMRNSCVIDSINSSTICIEILPWAISSILFSLLVKIYLMPNISYHIVPIWVSGLVTVLFKGLRMNTVKLSLWSCWG